MRMIVAVARFMFFARPMVVAGMCVTVVIGSGCRLSVPLDAEGAKRLGYPIL
nr:hypothetical protein [Mesorhizobium sp. STM 4661]